MKNTASALIILAAVAFCFCANAQNTVKPYNSKDRVLLPSVTADTFRVLYKMFTPRMTTLQRDAMIMTTNDEGAEIWNMTTHTKNYYNGTAWTEVITTP